MRRFVSLAILVIVSLSPGDAAAQPTCTPQDTIESCWERIAPERSDAPVLAAGMAQMNEETEEEAEDGVMAMPTGSDTGGLSLGSNTKDFLPRLALSGLLGEGETDETSGDLVFDLNFLIPGLAESNNAQLQLAIATESEISQVIQMALPEEGRADEVQKLEGMVGDADDYTVSFTYNWMGQNAGRSPKQYRDRLGGLLKAVDERVLASHRKAEGRYDNLLGGVDFEFDRLEDGMASIGADDLVDTTDPDLVPFTEIGRVWQEIHTQQLERTVNWLAVCGLDVSGLSTAEKRKFRNQRRRMAAGMDHRSLRSLVARAHQFCTRVAGPGAADAMTTGVEESLALSGIDPPLARKPISQVGEALGKREMDSLIGKVEAEARTALAEVMDHREEIKTAGLDSFADLVSNQRQLHASAKLRVREPLVGGDEKSLKLTYEWSAVNLKASMPDKCHDGIEDEEAEECLQEFTDYVEKNEDAIEDGTRFSFSGEWVEVDGDVISLPGQGITDLALPGSDKLVISVGWSRLFENSADQDSPLRLDFVGSFEDVSNDPMKKDRGVATLTVTRKFGDLSIPFGIVYANHSEFLTDVDERLSAHLGIKFDLDGGDE